LFLFLNKTHSSTLGKITMMTTTIQNIAATLPIFTKRELKEQFLFILGALTARLISLRKEVGRTICEIVEYRLSWNQAHPPIRT
jgi:hypothetical protein